MAYCSTPLNIEFDIREIITVHYFEYMKDFVFSGESHDFWEFLYVDKGEIIVQANHSFYQLKAGDVIFHKPNEFHALSASGNKAPNLVAVSFRCTSESMRFFEEKTCFLNQEERFLISRIIAEARQAFSTPLHIPSVEKVELAPLPLFGAAQLILLYLQIFLIHVKRNHFEEEGVPNHAVLTEQMVLSANSTHLEQIIQFMEFHICEHLSIKTICEEFSISRSTLHSLFHKEKNCGAIDYFNLMKIERSKEIMRDGNMNFTEIAYFLSYSSLQYFSKQFKKTTGMSPLEYFNSVKKYSNEITNASKKKMVDDRMI
ncbi:MAG: AraC family transcriptional regulator [Lacrimispora celerecrescens]|nr:AraC family transcriptional regulator [Lacrimispora celerecrescens]